MLATDYDVIVLGGGAAGLFCALTAGQRGRRVLLLESATKFGKKILMSGGGRCNFTNLEVSAENYISANPHFCKSALSRYTQWDFIALVEQYQIEYEERKHGQLFCLHSAKEILAMLVAECKLAGVEIETHCEINGVESAPRETGPGYRVTAMRGGKTDSSGSTTLSCASLVVATGALSIPTLGGSGMGYDIARNFGLEVLPRRAGLVPFMFSDDYKGLCERLTGTSLEVEISCAQQSFTEALLFTHRGISGPVALQISNYWRPGEALSIDLLPTLNAVELLLEAKDQQGARQLKNVLGQHLPRSLVGELQTLWWSDFDGLTLAQFSDSALRGIGEQLNHWQLKPSATEGYRTAEVTLGGVDTNELSSRTMEVRQFPGLYFIGEVVDVSGHLGGFNFQWAWSSGHCAGLFA